MYTPVWFAEDNGKLYLVSRADSGNCKRIRNNPRAKIAPCSIRGKITGPEFDAIACILPAEDWPHARKLIRKKYWLARLSFTASKNVYLEITPA